MENKTVVAKKENPHNIIIENRNKISATGIIEVLEADSGNLRLLTTVGLLAIGGSELKVEELSSTTGDIKILGEISFIQYQQKKKDNKGFFERLVR